MTTEVKQVKQNREVKQSRDAILLEINLPFCIAAVWQNFMVVFEPLRVSNLTIFEEWDLKVAWIWNCFWRIMMQLVRNWPRAVGQLKSTISFVIQLPHFPSLEDYWSRIPRRGNQDIWWGRHKTKHVSHVLSATCWESPTSPNVDKAVLEYISSTGHSVMYSDI